MGGAADSNGGAVSGYNLYRSTTSGGEYQKVNTSLIPKSMSHGAKQLNATVRLFTEIDYIDMGLENETTYYYVVKSVDSDGDESVVSRQASVTPKAGNGNPLSLNDSGMEDKGGGWWEGLWGGCFISTAAGGWNH